MRINHFRDESPPVEHVSLVEHFLFIFVVKIFYILYAPKPVFRGLFITDFVDLHFKILIYKKVKVNFFRYRPEQALGDPVD
jgi:hypothetical protein